MATESPMPAQDANGSANAAADAVAGAPAQEPLPEPANGAATNGHAKETTASPAPAPASDAVNPLDFSGTVRTNDALPTAKTLAKIADLPVFDRTGASHAFHTLHSGPDAPPRVLVVFVRHFFCGNCQEYLRALARTPELSPAALRAAGAAIVVVGCGDPALLDMYAEASSCPYAMYADPSRRLYGALGMVRTLTLGRAPAYMRRSLLRSSLDSIVQGLGQISKGLVLKAGDQKQVGGEFLFEAPPAGREGEKRVTWCHRMRTTRDHAEMPTLMAVLGLKEEGKAAAEEEKQEPQQQQQQQPPPQEQEQEQPEEKPAAENARKKRWSRVFESRKSLDLSSFGQKKAGEESVVAAAA